MKTENLIRSLLQISDDGTIPSGTIQINSSTLESIDALGQIPALLKSAFDNKPIVITNAQANPITDGPDVVITGTGGFSLTAEDVPTTLTLTFMEGNVQALLGFTVIPATLPETPWKFSDSFPDLPKVLDASDPGKDPFIPMDELNMSNAQFLVTTIAQTLNGQTLIAGINFHSSLTPSGILGVFEKLIGIGELTLQGTIVIPSSNDKSPALNPDQFPWELPDPVPGINLKIGLGVPAFALGGTSFSADFFRLYSASSAEWLAQNNTYSVVVGYTGTFSIPSASSTIGVTVLMPPGSATAKLIANFSNSPLGNFNQLSDILGISDVLSNFPQAIQGGDLGGLGIQTASVTIGFQTKLQVQDVSITVGMPKINWDVLSGYFEVKSVFATLDVQNPFDSATRAIDILVTGKVEVNKVPVDISAHKSSNFEVSASVASGFNVPLSSLMTQYAPGIPPVSDLSIDSLQLIVSPGNYFSFMLAMAQQPKPWVIPLGVTQLEFSDVELFILKPQPGDLFGSFSGVSQIAGVTLNTRYEIPGDVIIRGDFPSISLSQIVSFLTQKNLDVPNGFDITFTQSFIILEKKGNAYKLELGTVIDNIGSLAFVLENGATGWGVAAGLQIELSQLGSLSSDIATNVNTFASWFPFQSFTLAISTLTDQSFSFPGFDQFNQPSIGNSKITLPAIAKGIQPGFFLYTSTVFSRKNNTLKALIDLLKIPEGTQLDAFVAYLTNKKQFQLGISITTFLTPLKDVSQRTCEGDLGYQNSCLTGTIQVMAGGSDGLAFGLAASLKTILDNNNLEFDVVLTVVANGVFVSGTLTVQKPLTFGPLQLGGLALELGISFEGLPSFGFSAELVVDGLFDSTLAVLINTSNPSESMIAGALSNLTLGDVVAKLAGEINDELPAPIKSVLDEIGISGTKEDAFEVSAGTAASALIKALKDFDGTEIQTVFTTLGKQSSFPSTSDGMMIFKDADHGKWYITVKGGSGDSSTITHWQLIQNSQGGIDVSKEAQFYFVPSPSGVSVGTFFYPQGMKISGRIQFLFIDIDADIEIEVNKGIKVDAQMEKIIFLSDTFFSIEAEEGAGGPQVSIATFEQPSAPDKFRKPHFFVNGQMTILGAGEGIFVDINESGASFEVTGSSLGGFFQGTLNGNFNAKNLTITGEINIGIGSLDLGPLGTWNINTGIHAGASIFANLDQGQFGATFEAGFELAGNSYSIGKISLDVNVGKLSDLPGKIFDAVLDFLKDLFTDAKLWAEMAAKVLGWVEDKIKGVLEDTFGLSPEEAQALLSTLSAFCPIVTAVNLLG